MSNIQLLHLLLLLPFLFLLPKLGVTVLELLPRKSNLDQLSP